MNKFSYIINLLIVYHSFGNFANANKTKKYLIHSFSNVYDNEQYGKKLFDLFSNTVDGEMLYIEGDFDGNSSKFITNTKNGEIEVVSQDRGEKYVDRLCKRLSPETMHVYTIVTNNAQSSIFLYGCSLETLDNVKILIVESFTSKISQEFRESLSNGPIKRFSNPEAASEIGFCTCVNFQKTNVSFDIMNQTFLFIVVAVIGFVVFVAFVTKVFKVILADDQLPYVP